MRQINSVNKSAQLITSAIVSSLSGNNTVYLWDLLDPVRRFIFLNQPVISSDQSWNVTQQLQLNQTNLNWATIPSNVQIFLLGEQFQNLFVNLTFTEWGWITTDQTFENTTLYSLFTSQAKQNLPQIQSLLAPLNFNVILNTTVLTKSNRRMRPSEALQRLNEEVSEALPFAPYKQPNRRRRTPTPYDVIDVAVAKAVMTLWTYARANGIRMNFY